MLCARYLSSDLVAGSRSQLGDWAEESPRPVGLFWASGSGTDDATVISESARQKMVLCHLSQACSAVLVVDLLTVVLAHQVHHC
jgi:hypothetical protein